MEKKTIVITGSTRGIGLGLTREFLRRGHRLVINGRDNLKMSRVVEELQKISPDVCGVAGSVTKEHTHKALVEKAGSEYGRIDIWINNAGVPQPHLKFLDLDLCHLHQLPEVNITGLMLGSHIAGNYMLKQGFGMIFNMEGFGSDGRMMNKLTLYGTSKRAVNYFTKSLAKEMQGTQVQVGVLSPGMVRTDFITRSMESGSEEDAKSFNKVYNILSEDVETVTGYLVPRILSSNKNYDRIEFLKGFRLAGKIVRMMIAR